MPRPLLPEEVSPKVTERLYEGLPSGNCEAAWGTTSQALRASSPGRGATGESVMVVLDEQSFSRPETTGLRCFDSRLFAKHPLSERSPAVATDEDRARRLALHRACADSRACPACQGLPCSGSCLRSRLRGLLPKPRPSGEAASCSDDGEGFCITGAFLGHPERAAPVFHRKGLPEIVRSAQNLSR